MAYAPESGSDLTRVLIKKKMTASKLYESIDAATGAGLYVAVFLVIGFPHDRPEHLAENFPFIDELGRRGVGDIAVGYYMALPGTELFHSLYDAGRIKLDRRYFRHILEALAIVPSQSYAQALRPRDLVFWKLRLYRRFYGAKKRDSEGGALTSVRRALRGVFSGGDHATRLETAFRNGIMSGLETIRAFFGPRYMRRTDERAMIASWDGIYRSVRQQKMRSGAVERAPSDTSELHRTNVIAALTRDHATARSIAPAPLRA